MCVTADYYRRVKPLIGLLLEKYPIAVSSEELRWKMYYLVVEQYHRERAEYELINE